MFDSGFQDREGTMDHGTAVGHLTGAIPHGQIQKISQEGSKNTYVIILSKDYLKSESSQGQSLLKYSAGSNVTVKKKASAAALERDFDSPSGEVAVCKKKLLNPPEDVKLNLSNINDEEYDSNKSASSVFLQQDLSEDDSAIDVYMPMEKSGERASPFNSNQHSGEQSKMNTYVIPTPVKSRKGNIEKHDFLKTSPLKLNEQDSKSGFSAYSPNFKTSHPGTRKVIQLSSNQDSGLSGFKKTSFCNEAVPVMGKPAVNIHHTPISMLPKTNPKAVPTFSDISPISQQTASQAHRSTFIPINPADSPSDGATSTGPLTSTPLTGEPSCQKRKSHVIIESSTHRPVYVIPSPFARQNSVQSQQKLDISTPGAHSSSMNNSSGFISASSSLETPDASSSFDAEKSHPSGGRYSPMETNNVSPESKAEKRVAEMFKCDGSGGVVITVNESGDIEELDQGIDSNSLDPSVCSSQESETSEPEKVNLNQSLTNIQWLKGMQLKDEKPSSNSQYQQQQNIHCMTLSPEEIKQISKECGATKRPPFSYMSMIQMALYSREDRKMMLKEICKWIEDTFPYYKHTAKPGWRNSIRHNLSLYNIFEREPSKRHGSYWTIKSNVEPKMKQYPREKHSSSHHASETHRSMPTLPSQIPIIPMYSSMGQLSAVSPQTFSQSVQLPHNTAIRKKGQPPILPRPTGYSAYALIPIPNVNQSFNPASPNPTQPQVLLNLSTPGQMSACPSPIISEVSAAVASIQVSGASPVPQEHYCDTTSLQKEHFYNKPMNIVKHAWINCQNTDTASSLDSDRLSQTDITSSGEIVSSNEFTGQRTKSKRPRVKPGIPKPTFYKKEEQKVKTTGSKRRKLQQKVRTLSNESSDEDEDGVKFIANLEKEIFSKPFKSHEAEDMEHLLNTSTPAKGLSHSAADLPSPIHGFTPLRNSGLFDGSFLDTLGDRKALGLSPETSDLKKILQTSPSLGDSPDDFLDFNVLASPGKFEGSPGQNGNLSRILSECGLDPGMDNAENFPHLNWSVVDQIVDSMDTN
ncbi:forkhead box protein M1-like [Ruditapes philippinarum]|uniref:forkhead box protein M1-like n=1 Tax=Ruditapes philippinarum TaxID=129788 RepID=UPI00295A6342|nr:forkhead box protein M1-like [Ruditapes philippinarum]XP_060569990.1 forkhead box protein M1-like [Ruditapes philippinarum]